MSNPSATDMTFDFALAEGTAIAADFDKDPSNVTFSDGVTYDPATKQITVPAGVTKFTATVATTQDTIDEANETFTLTVGGESNTATIIDNDDT
ncbi:cadherin repeat domain-containing protein, partial [Vibrio sp. 10N.286.46.A8]